MARGEVMRCPDCSVHMHQDGQQGETVETDLKYTTWEIKKCPKCGRRAREYYEAELLEE